MKRQPAHPSQDAMQTHTAVDLIPAAERHREVASLLARGFVRYWRREAVDGGEKDLDVLRTSSEVCDEPQSEGESL